MLLMLTRASMAGGLALVLAFASLPAAAQQDGGLFGNIFKPQQQQQAPGPQPGFDASELVIRLERLENAVRNLTGQVEQLQYRNQQLEAQIKAGGAAPPAAAPAARPAPGGGRRSDAFDPAATPAAPGAPQPLGSPASAATNLPPRVDPARPAAGGQVTSGQVTGGQVASLPGTGSPREIYDAGLAQIQRQDYAGAEQTFRGLIEAHPNDRIIPDATFMLGESLFLRQNYGDASAAFLDVSTKYPNFIRAPEALLRLGQSLAAFGEKEAACATLQQVDRKYPRAPSPVRQSVEREQKRIGC